MKVRGGKITTELSDWEDKGREQLGQQFAPKNLFEVGPKTFPKKPKANGCSGKQKAFLMWKFWKFFRPFRSFWSLPPETNMSRP